MMHNHDPKKVFASKWLLAPLVGLLFAACAPEPGTDGQTEAPQAQPPAGGKVLEPSDWEVKGFAADRGLSLAEAKQRLTWQTFASDLGERARAALGQDFGGIWIDAGASDRVKVGAVRAKAARAVPGAPRLDPASVVAREASALGMQEGFDTVEVRFSMQELEDANAWIAAEIGKLGASGDAGLKTGLFPNKNAVQIDVPPDGKLTAPQEAMIAAAQAKFGDRIVLGKRGGVAKPNACVYPDCDPPLRGGVRIETPVDNNKVILCTSAFMAKSNINSALFMFTAGHCVYVADHSGGAGQDWFAPSSTGSLQSIGLNHHYEFDTANGDAAIINIDNPTFWNPQPEVFVTSGPDTTLNATYPIRATGASVQGQRICISGASSGQSDCGTVTALGVSLNEKDPITGGTFTLNNMGEASYCSIPGDSGAAVYASNTAFGIHSSVNSNDNCDAFYQGIRGAESVMNVKILLSP